MDFASSNANDPRSAVEAVLRRIDLAWREKRLEGLDECFSDGAVITGPEFAVYAEGRSACAESYREFASNASVLCYSESRHQLRIAGSTAIYTFSWEMEYRREGDSRREQGTDQLVLSQNDGIWQVVFRQILFANASGS